MHHIALLCVRAASGGAVNSTWAAVTEHQTCSCGRDSVSHGRSSDRQSRRITVTATESSLF